MLVLSNAAQTNFDLAALNTFEPVRPYTNNSMQQNRSVIRNVIANTIANNTIVTLAGARVNYAIGALALSGSGNTFSISNNYIDPTGVGNSIYKYTSSQNTQTNNVNMVTGALVGQTVNPGTPGPSPISLVESPSTGDLNAGDTVMLTLNMSGSVTVAGGTPTLTLNDGGTATYISGSGTSALTFSYTVGAGQNAASLAAAAVNLNGATMKDSGGNTANLSLTGLTQSGPQIDTTTPSVSSVVASGTGITAGSGDVGVGSVVTLTVNLSEAVTVAGGTPTLTLNDGGTATYTGGSGTNALTFSYTVGAGQSTSDLAVTAFNPNAATVKDGAGNAANLTGAVTTPTGRGDRRHAGRDICRRHYFFGRGSPTRAGEHRVAGIRAGRRPSGRHRHAADR